MGYEFDLSQLTLADYIAFCDGLVMEDDPAKAMVMYFGVIGKTIDLDTLSITEYQKVFKAFAKELDSTMRLGQLWSMPCTSTSPNHKR